MARRNPPPRRPRPVRGARAPRLGTVALVTALGGALAGAGAVAPGVSRAEPAPDLARARELYRSAETAMQDGRDYDAARDYGAAYAASGDPALFYKIGRANERAGKCDVAVVYYARYLREGKPTEQFAALTRERIAACGGDRPAAGGAGGAHAGDAAGSAAGASATTAGAASNSTGSGDAGPGESGAAGPASGTSRPGTGASGASGAAGPASGTSAAGASGAGASGAAGPASGTSGSGTGASGAAGGGRAPSSAGPAAAGAARGLTGDATASPGPAPGGSSAASPTGLESGASGGSAGALIPPTREKVAYLLGGGALALITLGGVLSYAATSSENDVRDLYAGFAGQVPPFDAQTRKRYDDLVDEGRRYQHLAWAAFSLAGAAAVGVAVLFAIGHGDESTPPRPATISPVIGPRGAGVSVRF